MKERNDSIISNYLFILIYEYKNKQCICVNLDYKARSRIVYDILVEKVNSTCVSVCDILTYKA